MAKTYYGLVYTLEDPDGTVEEDVLFSDNMGDPFTDLDRFDGVKEALLGFADQLGCKILDFNIVKLNPEPLD